MRVAATGVSKASELIFLNSEEAWTSEENFTIVLDRKAQETLKQQGVDDVRRHFEGQSIRIAGTLSLYRDRPQIIVSDAGKIQLTKR